MKNPVLKNKSFEFGIKIINYCQQLSKEDKEYVLSKQLMRSGTSIGALICEAEFGQSRADFISKMSIALKEANEVNYWLKILRDTKYIDNAMFTSINKDCLELVAILTAIIKTTKSKK